MSFYIYNIAVRWNSGHFEGFGASGLTEDIALQRAKDKAHRKASGLIDCGFDILTSAEYRALSIEEQDDIQLDWNRSSF